MPTEPERSNQPETSPWPVRYETGGEVLEDGTLIELTDDPNEENGLGLLKADASGLVFSPVVEHRGRTLVPLKVDRTIRQALRLASRPSPYTSIDTLEQELLVCIAGVTGLPEYPSQQLAKVVFCSWITEFLRAPLNVWLWSPFPPTELGCCSCCTVCVAFLSFCPEQMLRI